MPSKKKKYNARFPAGRIKKIMQTDEEVGKVAQAVPIIISRTLELFVESLLTKAMEITSAKNAKTLSPSHMKQCILSENRFDFLKDLVAAVPDVTACDSEEGPAPPNTSAQPVNSIGKNDTVSSGVRRFEGMFNKEDRGHVHPPSVTSNKMNANFYKEQEEASMSNVDNCAQHVSTPNFPQSSVVHPYASKSAELEDSDDENEEYKPPIIVSPFVHTQASSASSIDEDYDT